MTVKVQIKSQIFYCRKQFVLGGRHAILGIRGNWRKIRRGLKYSDNLRKAAWDVWPCTQLDLMMEICKCEKAQRRTFPESGPSHQMWKILIVTKKNHRMFKIKCWLDLYIFKPTISGARISKLLSQLFVMEWTCIITIPFIARLF